MGSDLYIAIDTKQPDNETPYWRRLWEGPSTYLARGIVVDAFRVGEDNAEWPQPPWGDEEPPWSEDEPYWVRLLDGALFCDIIRERRWKTLQDGDFADVQADPVLRAFGGLVAALLAEGMHVRVWCWHSQ